MVREEKRDTEKELVGARKEGKEAEEEGPRLSWQAGSKLSTVNCNLNSTVNCISNNKSKLWITKMPISA